FLQSHAEFTNRSTLGNLIHHLQNEHLGDAGSTILFHHSERDKSDESDFPAVIEELYQSDWHAAARQTAIEVAQGNIDIRNADGETNRLLSDLCDQDASWDDQRLHLSRHVLRLGFRERNEPPVFSPRLIVNGV